MSTAAAQASPAPPASLARRLALGLGAVQTVALGVLAWALWPEGDAGPSVAEVSAWVLGLGLVVGGFTHALLRAQLTQPMWRLRQAVQALGRGDLTVDCHLPGQDDLAQLASELDHMRTHLNRVMGTLKASSDFISTAAHEIAVGNTDLSGRTERAASSLQQTASSMEQLTGTVRQVSDSASTANQLASSAAHLAQSGGHVVTQVVQTMDEIHASSSRIADIITVIDDIAFQTNILALNAAVEAARAGEQGRGFAVVAGEVRSLARRSAKAAGEIKGLITDSVAKVASGAQRVTEAGRTMNDIVSSAQRVADIIGEVTASSSEQTQGIVQVNQAVSQLDQVTQQNAALVEQSAAAAESLREQAERLTELVKPFRLSPGLGAGY